MFRWGDVFKPIPTRRVSEWADDERRLSSEASAEPGRWSTARAEYQRGMMDALNEPNVHTICLMTSAQVGKSEGLLNMLGYLMAEDPCPILVLMPTVDMAQALSKDRIAPMVRDTPVLADKVSDPKSRDGDNRVLYKKFPGGHMTMVGANAPAGLASRPIRVVLADEVDRFPASAGTEGDPLSLAMKRTTTFWNRKVIVTSTPTVRGHSRIEALFEQSDQRYYEVPCPHCEAFQRLVWANVKWPEGQPEKAFYVCEHCGVMLNDGDKLRALPKGRWSASKDPTGIAGFHLSELYSPWVTFGETAQAFIRAKALPETLKTWVNTALGETWEEQGESVDADSIAQRAEDYEDVPDEGVLLTLSVDVQDDRLEAELKAWGRDSESWGMEHIVWWGDPGQAVVWQKLEEYLGREWYRADGYRLRIAGCGIDSGGHHTQAVYEFCKSHGQCHALKGVGGQGRALVARPSKGNRQRVYVWPVGVDTGKEIAFSRLGIESSGPGFCHFNTTYDPEWFAQLTAEKRVTAYRNGVPYPKWVATRKRNEAFDLQVYHLAVLEILQVDLNKLATKAEKLVSDEPQSKPRPKRKQRRGGFVNGWR